MRVALTLLLATPWLAACVSQTHSADPYPFVGSWDCGVAVFRFTDTTYDNGSQSFPIRAVARDGRNFTLWLGDGSTIGLVAVTETGLTWVSGRTGNQLNCRRVK